MTAQWEAYMSFFFAQMDRNYDATMKFMLIQQSNFYPFLKKSNLQVEPCAYLVMATETVENLMQ